MAVADKLDELRRRADELRSLVVYDRTWPEKAAAAKRELKGLRLEIEAEEARLASLSGLGRAERQAVERLAEAVERHTAAADAFVAEARKSISRARASLVVGFGMLLLGLLTHIALSWVLGR